MTQEEKQLLLKDLCARLPYGVICKLSAKGANISITEKLDFGGLEHFIFGTMDVKPYLRPMSSMTEEEERKVRILWNEDFIGDNNWYHCYPKTTDFYLSHHFDFRNLIQKGLALEAPEGTYKTE